MGKQIHNLVLCRKGREPFGFRIIGGKDEGLSFKVCLSKRLLGMAPSPEWFEIARLHVALRIKRQISVFFIQLLCTDVILHSVLELQTYH